MLANCDIVTYGYNYMNTVRFSNQQLNPDNKLLIKTWYNSMIKSSLNCVSFFMNCPNTPYSNCNGNITLKNCIFNVIGFTIDKTDPLWIFSLTNLYNGTAPYSYFWFSNPGVFSNSNGFDPTYAPELIIPGSHPLTNIAVQVTDSKGCISNFNQIIQF